MKIGDPNPNLMYVLDGFEELPGRWQAIAARADENEAWLNEVKQFFVLHGTLIGIRSLNKARQSLFDRLNQMSHQQIVEDTGDMVDRSQRLGEMLLLQDQQLANILRARL